MQELTGRLYFLLCRVFGQLLRSGRYAKARVVDSGGERQVRKRRMFYAPLFVWMGDPLVRILDTGVRILPQREWEEQERRIYQTVHNTSIRIDAGGTLVLPFLTGKTLATWLDDSDVEDSIRERAIELAAVALVDLHRLGLTHGDAMAENVMVDLDAGVARWFDFETLHDSSRPLAWRRADDVRALLTTCLLRTAPGKLGEILQLILNTYADEEVSRLVAANFTSAFQRALTFHLSQAGLSFQRFREIARLLKARVGD